MADGPPAHVLMTADTVGGVFTYAVTLAGALAARGVRVTFATMGEPLRASQRAAIERIAGATVHESCFALEWMDEPWADVARAGEWLLELERAASPDVVHLNGYCHAPLPFAAPTVVVGHSCVLSWWSAVLREPAPARYARYREEVKRGLHAAARVVAPTAAMLRALDACYGALPDARVIPNASPPPRGPAIAKEPFILGAGRLWDPAKNVAALDAAARDLPWPVYVAGSDRSPDGARAAFGAVRPLGWLDDDAMDRWMARAAIFALPARYEPFGLSALEAALRGCALVLGDIPSLREVWGEAAVFVAPDDHAALARVLARLAGDPAERERMARLARARAQTFTVERSAAAYAALYAEILTERQAPHARLLPCA